MRYANYSRFGTRKRKSIFFSCLIIFVISGFVLSALLTTFTSTQSDALSGSDFRTARIIDDGIFFNGDAMPASSIQNFLNAKVPTCDTWGTQMRGSQTRAQYGASVGNPAPYTCLKNYRQDTPAMSAESSLCNSISAN